MQPQRGGAVVRAMLVVVGTTALLLSPRTGGPLQAVAFSVQVGVPRISLTRTPTRTARSTRGGGMWPHAFTLTTTTTTALGMVDNSVKYLLIPQLRNKPSYPTYQGSSRGTMETTTTGTTTTTTSSPDPLVTTTPEDPSPSDVTAAGDTSNGLPSPLGAVDAEWQAPAPSEVTAARETSNGLPSPLRTTDVELSGGGGTLMPDDIGTSTATPHVGGGTVDANAIPGSFWDFIPSSGGGGGDGPGPILELKPLLQVPELRVPKYQLPMPDLSQLSLPDLNGLHKLGFQFRPTPIESPNVIQQLPALSKKLLVLQQSVLENIASTWDEVTSRRWWPELPSQFELPPIVTTPPVIPTIKLPSIPTADEIQKIKLPSIPTADDASRYLTNTFGNFEYRDPLANPAPQNPLWENTPLFPTERFLSSIAAIREILESQPTSATSQESDWEAVLLYYGSLWSALDLAHLGTWYVGSFLLLHLILRRAGGVQNTEPSPEEVQLTGLGPRGLLTLTSRGVGGVPVNSTSTADDEALLVHSSQTEELNRATAAIKNELEELEMEKISRDYEVATLKSELRMLKSSVDVSGKTEQQLSSKLQDAEGQVERLLKEKAAMESELVSLKRQLESLSARQSSVPKTLVEINAVAETEAERQRTSVSSSPSYRNNIEMPDPGPLFETRETLTTRNNSEEAARTARPTVTPTTEILPEEAAPGTIPPAPASVPLPPAPASVPPALMPKVAVTGNFFSLVEEEPEDVLTPAMSAASTARSSAKSPSTKSSKKSTAKAPSAAKAQAAAKAPSTAKAQAAAADDGAEDWSALSEAAIKRKTVKELVSFLESKRITTTDVEGKILRKAELVEAVISELRV